MGTTTLVVMDTDCCVVLCCAVRRSLHYRRRSGKYKRRKGSPTAQKKSARKRRVMWRWLSEDLVYTGVVVCCIVSYVSVRCIIHMLRQFINNWVSISQRVCLVTLPCPLPLRTVAGRFQHVYTAVCTCHTFFSILSLVQAAGLSLTGGRSKHLGKKNLFSPPSFLASIVKYYIHTVSAHHMIC